MILNAYTVYDRKALQYHSPFFAVADGAAVRSFMDLANDPQTTVGRHPGDYVLYFCGCFDDGTGLLLPASPIKHVCDAQSLVKHQEALAFDPNRTDNNTSVKSMNGKEV